MQFQASVNYTKEKQVNFIRLHVSVSWLYWENTGLGALAEDLLL